MVNQTCHYQQGDDERGRINDFPAQVPDLQGPSSPICSEAGLSWQAFIPLFSTPQEKKGKIFVQELEKLYQHFLSKRYDRTKSKRDDPKKQC